MSLAHRSASSVPQFVSPKTVAPVPVRDHLVREALIQASLDPEVRSIEFVATARVRQAQVALDTIVIVRDDGRFYLDVLPARPVRDVEAEGLALLALDSLKLAPLTLSVEDIRREPLSANSRLVWSYRDYRVGIGMRMRILQTLTDDGPMQLGQLLATIRAERDPSPAVMALACANLIDIDLVSQPLGPQTMVRQRA